MRLWSLHPQYLDRQGLLALWRESLLARAVLAGRTRGYREHPQLIRFREHALPRQAIAAYLAAVRTEATAREYRFDGRKIGRCAPVAPLVVTTGQAAYEWDHLLRKLAIRSPEHYRRVRRIAQPEPHPMFRLAPGPVAPWERVHP